MKFILFVLRRSSNVKAGKKINMSTKLSSYEDYVNQAKSEFGMKNKSNIGKLAFTLMEVEYEKLLSAKEVEFEKLLSAKEFEKLLSVKEVEKLLSAKEVEFVNFLSEKEVEKILSVKELLVVVL